GILWPRRVAVKEKKYKSGRKSGYGMSRIYFDYNATAPLRPEARQAVVEALDAGNASSVHHEGRAARALIESARATLAAALGTRTDLVVFVSGATEAANMALRPQSSARDYDLLLVGDG